jgi:hypothetical protein
MEDQTDKENILKLLPYSKIAAFILAILIVIGGIFIGLNFQANSSPEANPVAAGDFTTKPTEILEQTTDVNALETTAPPEITTVPPETTTCAETAAAMTTVNNTTTGHKTDVDSEIASQGLSVIQLSDPTGYIDTYNFGFYETEIPYVIYVQVEDYVFSTYSDPSAFTWSRAGSSMNVSISTKVKHSDGTFSIRIPPLPAVVTVVGKNFSCDGYYWKEIGQLPGSLAGYTPEVLQPIY